MQLHAKNTFISLSVHLLPATTSVTSKCRDDPGDGFWILTEINHRSRQVDTMYLCVRISTNTVYDCWLWKDESCLRAEEENPWISPSLVSLFAAVSPSLNLVVMATRSSELGYTFLFIFNLLCGYVCMLVCVVWLLCLPNSDNFYFSSWKIISWSHIS